MAGTILCYRIGRPNSLVNVDADIFARDNAAAKEAGHAEPWVKVDSDINSAPTFDSLTPEGQKAVKERQAERAKAIEEARRANKAE